MVLSGFMFMYFLFFFWSLSIVNVEHLYIILIEKKSSYPDIDNKKKDVLIFGKGPMQGLEH